MALFQPEIGLIFWMLVIFLIIFGILAKYAWPIIVQSIEQRAELIDNGVKYAHDAREELEKVHVQVDNMLMDAHRKQLEILQEAELMKQDLIKKAKKDATDEAQKVMESAKLSIEQAQREAEQQIRKQVERLSLDIAGKVLRERLSDDSSQLQLVNRMLDELERK